LDKYKKLITNTAVLALGTLGSKILVFLLMPLYTRLLTSAQYSTADIISQTANLLIPLISLGMYEAVFRFAMDKDIKSEKVLTTGLYVTLAGCVIFALFLPLLCKIGYFDGYFPLVYLYVFCASVHYLVSRYTRAIGQNTLFALQGIISTALNITFNIIFLIGFDMGVTGYVLSVIVSDLLVSLFLFIKLGLLKKIAPSNFSRELFGTMLKYSVPLIPTTVFWWVTNVADRYMIDYFDGGEINGLYAVAFKVPTLLILVSGIFSEAWQYSAVTDGNDEDRQRFFSRVFDSFQSIIFIAASALILLAKFFTEVLLADAYAKAWQYMPVLIAATVFSSLVTFMSSVYVKHKRSVNSFVTAMIGALSNMLLNFLLIPRFSAQGAAIATLACYVIVYIIRAIDSQRYEKFNTKPVVMLLNTLIIAFQCTTMLLEIKYWWLCGIASFAALGIINMRALLSSVKTVFGSVFSRLGGKKAL